MRRTSIAFLALSLVVPGAQSQGTLQYDQQSATVPVGADILWDVQPNGPLGQTFVPSLSAVGFVQLELFDGHPDNGLGATLYVNLRSDSMTGAVLSTSSPVYMPETPSGGGVTNFFFSPGATVVPGTTYFFEIVVQSGDLWRANVAGRYLLGNAYFQGVAQPFDDLWFREGIIVPEPSSTLLLLLAAFCCFIRWRLRS